MKKITFATVLLASFFVFSTVPAVTHAAEQSTKPKQSKKAAEAARKACEKRVGLYAGFARDIENWSAHQYVMPADLSPYVAKEIKDIDGEKRKVVSSKGKVTVYKNGKAVQISKTNYAIMLKRHQDASSYAAKKADVTAYNGAIGNFSAALERAKASNSSLLGDWNSKFANVNCGTGEGHHKAKDLVKLRASTIKAMHKDLNSVKKSSNDTQKEYKKVAVAYAKKVKAEKKAANTSSNMTGGVQAP